VMGTNNSSIASKRSVELLYYPKPHFFKYFVKKPQRRSPLINRGYWLRMHAMAESVRRFMKQPSDKPKFVLNLGCGL
jgi:tRNA wybutosine-synthesizing protein 4